MPPPICSGQMELSPQGAGGNLSFCWRREAEAVEGVGEVSSQAWPNMQGIQCRLNLGNSLS